MSEAKSGFSQPSVGQGPGPARTGLLAARDFLEVRFGGTAEQGVIFMGVVVAMAATRDHRYVTQTQTHGLEEMAEHGHSDVIISDEAIDYPDLQGVDLLVALCQASAEDYCPLLRGNGVFIYDVETVTAPPFFAGVSFGIPFGTLASQVAGRGEPAPELVTLGAVSGITGAVSSESLRKTVKGIVIGGSREANQKALSLGLGLDPGEWRRDLACL